MKAEWSRRLWNNSNSAPKFNKVLIFDDSVCFGRTMAKLKDKIKSFNITQDVLFGAVYITPESAEMVDLFFEICPLPRLFEWNVMHHSRLINACVDFDGVICRNPTGEENDDGVRYRAFLKNAEPLFIPSQPIGYVVTCRLEKYRTETEQWLSNYGINYQNLFMMNLPDKRTRVTQGSHGKFKAEIYKDLEANIFIESSYRQSLEIASWAGKPVFCIENQRFVLPPISATAKSIISAIPARIYKKCQLQLFALQSRLKSNY
jgi:orotate phosphoribosyltransferase